MKKIDLVHITILIIALLAGYAALEQVLIILSMLGYTTSYGMPDGFSRSFFFTILSFIFLSACCLILIRKGKSLAFHILKNEHETPLENAPQLQLDRWNIIFALFIGMGLYSLIQTLPVLLRDLFEFFRNKVALEPFKGPTATVRTVVLEALRVTLGTFLIYAASPLTNFINQRIARRPDGNS